MFEMENYKSIQFFRKEELLDAEILLQMGYQESSIYALLDCSHKTTYYYHPEKPFVYIVNGWNIGTENEYYIQLIVSRDIVEKLGFPKTIYMDCEKRTKKAVVYIGERKQLIKTFLPKRVFSAVTKYTTLNIIDSQTTNCYNAELEKKGIIYPNSFQHSISVMKLLNGYGMEIIDKRPSDKSIEEGIREKGYKFISLGVDFFRINKAFNTEYEAWKDVWKYECEYYQHLRFDPFADYLSHNFEVAFKVMISEEMTEEEVMKMVLYAWRMDWSKIVKLNLEELYDKYKIPYIGVESSRDGSMIPDYSNQEEVENFIMV